MLFELGPRVGGEYSGGVESHIMTLCKGLARQGHEITFLTGPVPNAPQHEVLGSNFTVWRPGWPWLFRKSYNPSNLLFARQFWFLILTFLLGLVLRKAPQRRWDVVHGHIYSSGMAAWWLARCTRAACINTIHGSYYYQWRSLAGPWRGRLFQGLERFLAPTLAQLVDAQIHADQFFAKTVARWAHYRAKLLVFHNTVDTTVFHPDLPPSSEILRLREEGVPQLLTIRRLVRKNGLHLLVRAVAELTKNRPIQLVIVGQGPEVVPLQQLVRSLGLADKVLFYGPCRSDQVAPFLRSADLVVVPSLVEASSIGVLEAMAVGAPLVVSRIPGIEEITSPALVTYADPPTVAGLVKALETALDDPSVAVKGRSGVRHVQEGFTTEVQVRRHERLYYALL